MSEEDTASARRDVSVGKGAEVVVLRECWSIILRRRKLIAAVSGLLLVVSAIFSLTRTPGYRATAVMQVSPGGTINLVDDRVIEEVRVRYDEFFATQQAILRSRNLARRVMDELQLWEHPLFGNDARGSTLSSDELRTKKVEALQEMLQVEPVGETQLLEISFVTPEPELSAKLANTLADQYVLYAAESISGVARTTSSFIRDQIAKLHKEIAEKERLLQEYSQRDDLGLLDEGDDVLMQQIEDLSKELAEVQAERVEAAARYRSLQDADVNSFPEILDNRTIEDLKRDESEMQRRYAELAAKFLPSYPELQRTRAALEAIEERLARETNGIANKVISAARVRFEIARRREAYLLETLEKQRQDERDRNLVASDFRRVKAELDNQRAVLGQLMRRQSATGLSAELGEREPSMTVHLVDAAVVPTRRFAPWHRVNIGLGGIVGIALGVGLAFFLHYREGLIYTAKGVRRCVDWPILGSVPQSASGNGNVSLPSANAADAQGRFLAWLILGRDVPPKSILVTSSSPSEGKTFVASHLAAWLTELGRKVLLVDANLRAPRLHDLFQLDVSTPGLTRALDPSGQTLSDCVQKSGIPGLSVIAAGEKSENATEMLSSQHLMTFLKEATQAYDCVVIDSAPLLPFIESHLLMRQCDAVVLVARSGVSKRQSLETVKQLIARENGRIAGVVLNETRVGSVSPERSARPNVELSGDGGMSSDHRVGGGFNRRPSA